MATSDTNVKDIPGIVAAARASFESGATTSVAWRKKQIQAVMTMVEENMDVFMKALKDDLGGNDFWCDGVELATVAVEGKEMLHNLESWSAPRKVGTPLLNLPAWSWISPEAFGVVLSISPWNYPVSLCLVPLMTALAAGNVVVLKPSELSVHSSAAIVSLLPKYLDQNAFQIVTGNHLQAGALLKERFDFIHYTGGTAVGRIVYKAAAEHMTPVLLELGGKSPAVISPSTNVDDACKRIAWGKWTMNMGQTCISPDYIITTPDMVDKVVAKMKTVMLEFYSETPKESDDVSRIISERHAQRIASMLDDDTITVEQGGDVDLKTKYISPTLIRATEASKCMVEEIFGPVLPVIVVDSVDDAIAYIKRGEKPLALYAFGSSAVANDIVKRTSSGGAVINDVVWHCGNSELPFGGVGQSGIGAYHGKIGFDTFSHLKAVLQKGGSDPSLRFPPYTPFKLTALKRLRTIDGALLKKVGLAILVVVAAWYYQKHYSEQPVE